METTQTSSSATDDEQQTGKREQSLELNSRVREPLSTIETYCQSKTYTAQSGINPLITAANPLFSLASKLSKLDDYADLEKLQKSLCHEIKAFESNAHTHGYSNDQILIARYSICATLDEIIQNTPWGMQKDWQQYSLLYQFQGDTWGGEIFFLILERLMCEAKDAVDLLEFKYLCLSTGFMGKYRILEKGGEQIAKVTDDLYRLIRDIRGVKPLRLSNKQKSAAPTNNNSKRKNSILGLGMGLCLGIMVIYVAYNALVGVTTKPIYTKLAALIEEIPTEMEG